MLLTRRALRILASTAVALAVSAPASVAVPREAATGSGPAGISTIDDWASVSATGDQASAGHTCGLQQDRSLWCWGRNENGQLGLGDTADRWRPVQVGRGTWEQVVTYGEQTRGISVRGARGYGALLCWGAGYGDTPKRVGKALAWTAVALGDDYWCATQVDDTLWCYGANDQGQLGAGDYDPHPYPVQIQGSWQSVTANAATTCALRDDQTLWCWGDDRDGQLGDDRAHEPSANVPVQVAPGSTWLSVVEGRRYTCGIQASMGLWCWGDNDFGNLGLGDEGAGTERSVPTEVGDAGWLAVSAGVAHTCGVQTGDRLYCWGSNASGELGIGRTGDPVDSPARVQGDRGLGSRGIGAGGPDTCAIKSDHTLWCWGLQDHGELGIGERDQDTTMPVQVGLSNPQAPVSAPLASVSADSATDLWAVGSQRRKNKVTTLVVHGVGATWSIVKALDPSRTHTEFTAVKALAPDDVWAVGSYVSNGTTVPLAEHWGGSAWTDVGALPGEHHNGEFLAVDALSSDDVWAVGETWDSGYSYYLVEHWDGAAWTTYDVSQDWDDLELTGVVELSANDVWMVGHLVDDEGTVFSTSYHWDGSTWKRVDPTVCAEFDNFCGMRAVDATPTGDVWAAGDAMDGGPPEVARVSRVVNGHWRNVHAPSHRVGRGTFVRGVAAVAADDVWMVGDYDTGTSSSVYTMHWNGSAWRKVPIANPGGKTPATRIGASISAVGGDDVWAVGSWDDGLVKRPYVEHWDGTKWRVVLRALPK